MKKRMPLIYEGECVGLRKRGISQATCERFSYSRVPFKDGFVQSAPYHDAGGTMVAQKLRFRDKGMTVTGSMPGTLFGQQLFRPKDNIRVVITEGEIDALSVYETQGNWPVVSVPNGASGAKRAAVDNLEWLEGFKEVVICFDMDEPGRKAALEVAEVLCPGKAFIAQLPLKDASDMVTGGRKDELRKALWDAVPYRPEQVVRADTLFEEMWEGLQVGSFASYPWPKINDMLQGLRAGEIVVWTAGSGVGKSTATREITHALTQSGHTVGCIALEEAAWQSVMYQTAIELGQHLHLGLDSLDRETVEAAFNKVSERLVVHSHWGSLESSQLASQIRYMALGEKCEVIILDHISIVVSGQESTNERKDLDMLMTSLRSLAEDLQINIQVVSHIKRIGDRERISKTDLRGSAAIEQLADQIVALERDAEAGDRHTEVRVLKNRPAGWLSGHGGWLEFDIDTGRLVASDGPDEEDDLDDDVGEGEDY